ncbi:type II toxin-antitoxin system ParD family antitoxin [Candidatus Bathyarchaeota archaeon]|nr:type II toxin-antitoxin system ParD family antitoxin [Candidatus Bathyarchaeota archaeon]
MKLISLHIPEVYLEGLQELVAKKYYPNRAEAIRIAVKDLLNDEVWSKRRAQNGA